MPHTHRRPRRYVGRLTFTLLQPIFRHSLSRDAWVLRGVGERRGPVLRKRQDDDAHSAS